MSTSCSACGKLTPLAACTFAQGTLDAQGVCRDSKGNVDAAAVGFAAIDGFSTTGMILAQTSDLIAARTVTPSTVQLWEVPASGSPVKVDLNTYISEPCEVTSSCDPNVTTALSPVIALQPAGATALDNSGSPVPSVFRTRPLKDKTDYAVVISDGVRDKTDKAISRSTVARILQFTNPLSVGGKSQLIGIDDATAGALEAMRLKIAPVVAASGFATDHVAIAYTFHTQSILSTAVQLGALPYSKDPSTALPAAPTALTVANAFAKYGVGSTVANTGNVAEVLETTITTFNLIDPANGAFNQTGATANETINVLIAYPDAATVTFPACPAALAPFGKKCSPLVVFRHGIGRGRADILTVADTLAGKGFTVVAIDAAKHGDRSFCVSGQTNVTGTTLPQCAGGGTCNAIPGTQGQADANPPGTCSAGFTYQAVSPACNLNPASCGPWTGAQGIPVVSSSFLISANFFRTRDTFRQDIIDQSQLVRAIAFVPSGPPPTAHPLFDHLFGKGVIIDPGQVFFVGQSLGAIQGTLDVAANPRVSTAVLNVGGGTLVDVFTTSPAFSASTNTLLASLGIQAGANSDYLKFLVVAKTVLDPADPVNFAGHLTDPATTLPNLLADPNGSVRQSAKQVLTQVAFCDQTVPNPWNYILDSTAGTGPFPGFPGFGGPGTFQLFFKGSATPSTLASCPTPSSTSTNAIPHGFFTAWTAGATAQTAQAQSDAAAFLVDPAANKPASLRTF
ncbi:MAG: hypothetical protein E6J65_27240 [Deltaproteobacteria bacterium]|nr:MAG: hypothetical protein E6J65_27240 [Deltaproteobacteria bacterium]